jgi:hypothetical protein
MTDLQKGGPKWDANFIRAERMKMYRQFAGLSGVEAAVLLKTDDANYHRKERGLTTVRESEVRVLEKRFKEYRQDQIKSLEAMIAYLKAIP